MKPAYPRLSCLAEGLVAGAIAGSVETTLAFSTGSLPASDWGLPFASGLVVSSVAASLLGFTGLPPRALQALLLVGPVLVATLRGHFAPAELAERWWVPAAQWGIGALLVLAILRLFALSRSAPFSPRRFLLTSLTTQWLAFGALAARTTHPDQLLELRGLPELAAVVAVSAAQALTLVLVARTWGRTEGHGRLERVRLAAAASALSALSPMFTAAFLGTRAQRYETAAGADANKPNVLLIVMDTVRQDHLSMYGYPRQTSPNLARFASRALLFEHAYATSPYTLSSHASLFTGKMPSEHGAHREPYTADRTAAARGSLRDYPLPASEKTLAESLARSGYATAAIVANTLYLREWTGLDRGFTTFDGRNGRHYGYVPTVIPALKRLHYPSYERVSNRVHYRDAEDISSEAISWLAALPRGPFFLFLNYMDAHQPLQPRRRHADRFPAARGLLPTLRTTLEGASLTESQRRVLVDRYDAGIHFVDEQIGRLLDWLSREGKLESTLVVITSDHGEMLGEHGQLLHANGLREQVLRIPLVVRLPGQANGQRASNRVSLADVPGWIEQVVAGDQPRLGPFPEPRIVAEFFFSRPNAFGTPYLRAAFSGGYKLVQHLTQRDELFDTERDRAEEHDLLKQRGGSDLRAEILSKLPPAVDALIRPGALRLDPGHEERLRALGYVH